MSEQRFMPWVPIPGVPTVAYVEAVHDEDQGLILLLRGRGEDALTLRLTFESVVAYRNINESYRLATWNSVEDMAALPSLLVVENSRWIGWLITEAGGFLLPERLTHFAIYSPEDCMDIVTEFDPEASWVNT